MRIQEYTSMNMTSTLKGKFEACQGGKNVEFQYEIRQVKWICVWKRTGKEIMKNKSSVS